MSILEKRDPGTVPDWFAHQTSTTFDWPTEVEAAVFSDIAATAPASLEAVMAGLRNL